MSRGRLLLFVFVLSIASSAAVAAFITTAAADWAFLVFLNGVAFAPMLVIGSLMLDLKISRSTYHAMLASGWFSASAGLLASWLLGFSSQPIVGPFLPTLVAMGCSLLGLFIGVMVGAAMPQKLPNPMLCVHCGYDRHGLDRDAKCPECGSAP